MYLANTFFFFYNAIGLKQKKLIIIKTILFGIPILIKKNCIYLYIDELSYLLSLSRYI